jgi:16S rRNA G1207 methylase RsmC
MLRLRFALTANVAIPGQSHKVKCWLSNVEASAKKSTDSNSTHEVQIHADDASPGSFALTPASYLSASAVFALTQAGVLHGKGIDWGCGNGVLALTAALAPNVTSMCGLDLTEANVTAAHLNQEANSDDPLLKGKELRFARADSFTILDKLDEEIEPADFVVANPPACNGDGFGFRRRILAELGEANGTLQNSLRNTPKP